MFLQDGELLELRYNHTILFKNLIHPRQVMTTVDRNNVCATQSIYILFINDKMFT